MTPNTLLFRGAGGMLVLAGAFVYHVGAIRVDVREKSPQGEHVRLFVPAVLAPLGARMVPRAKLREASKDLQQWLPVIEAASEELARCPDGLLVAVDSPHEHVRIAKAGGALVIDVDDPGETVHLSVPLQALAYTVRQLVVETPDGPPA